MTASNPNTLNPYVTIWLQPRATFAYLSNSSKRGWMHFVFAGLLGASIFFNQLSLGVVTDLGSAANTVVVIYGVVISMIAFFLFSLAIQFIYVTIFAGNFFKVSTPTRVDGKGLRFVLGWALLPMLVGQLLSAMIGLVRAIIGSGSDGVGPLVAGLPFPTIWGSLIAAWSLVLGVLAVSEFLKLSTLKAATVVVLTIIMLSIPSWRAIDSSNF
jgi:hypothetical protein